MEVRMKGVVFVELIAMAESMAGEDAVDEIIESCDLESGGAFTTVGNYPCSELMIIVHAFSVALDAPVADLQRQFGEWMFRSFAVGYPEFFVGKNDAFTMLESIENEVHVEVRKLYPEVELPSFDTRRENDGSLIMSYQSERPLVDFCHGMIVACVDHFKDEMLIEFTSKTSGSMFAADFQIRYAA
jgi:hypothetical protein